MVTWAMLLARRLVLVGAAVVIVVSFSTALLRLAPGRFGDEMMLEPALGEDTRRAVMTRALAGAEPTAWRWLTGLVRGEPGYSLASGAPVGSLILSRGANTLLLTVPASLLAWAVGLVSIAPSARQLRRIPAASLRLALAALQALPDPVAALLLVGVAMATGWFPVGGQGAWDVAGEGSLLELAHHAALPVVGLTLLSLPMVIRHLSAAVGPVAASPFVRAARARGLGPAQVFRRHELPAALPAIAPLAGLSAASLLSGGLMVEVVFAWPGLGPLLVDAVAARDVPVVLGSVSATAVLVGVSNAVSDVLQQLADPRPRA